MRFRDKIRPLHYPILKPANLPDFLTGARIGVKRPEKKLFKSVKGLVFATIEEGQAEAERREAQILALIGF